MKELLFGAANRSPGESAQVWRLPKSLNRQSEARRGAGNCTVFIVDNSVLEKVQTDFNILICYYLHYRKQSYTKELRFVSLLYQAGAQATPITVERVRRGREHDSDTALDPSLYFCPRKQPHRSLRQSGTGQRPVLSCADTDFPRQVAPTRLFARRLRGGLRNQTSLYKPRRQPGYPVSGQQRHRLRPHLTHPD